MTRLVFTMTPEMLAYFQTTGREGGVKCWEGVSAEDRAAHARKAAKARWATRTAAEKAAHARMMVEARERKRAARKRPPLKKPTLRDR
jgi:hypothetical protein